MIYIQSSRYILKWEYISDPKYKWSECGKLFNTHTGKEIRKVMCGRSIGYCLNGKFKSLNTLRKQLVKIQEQQTPF